MPGINTSSVTLKCSICGGEIRADYLSASCVCAHCGNKQPITDILPEYANHATAVEKIRQARSLMEEKPDVAKISQAKLLLHQASTECFHTDTVSADLLKVCKDGIKETEDLRHYAVALSHMEKKNYRQAITEFERIPGFRDTDKLVEDCKVLAVKDKKKQIPIAIAIGLVIPIVLGVLLYEKTPVPIWAIIPICLTLAAGCSYAVYLENTLSIVIIVASFLSAVPLILFMILAYGYGMESGPAATIAIGAPVALVVAAAFNSKPGK
ncbi:MAG: hypothetical protein J5607_03080 [Clostridiales bacterium]|nr:hypothetical protein [Clostridiales bacterium]